MNAIGRDSGGVGAARLWVLAASGAVLGVCLVGFDLLYLFVPAGWTPPYGFAPDVGAAVVSRFPALKLDLSPPLFRALALAGLAGMWAAFLVAVRQATVLCREPALRRRAQRIVAIEGAVVALALILSPPTLSKDLFRYAAFGKMLVAKGLNPYVAPVDALTGDPLWALANFRDLTTHYGPLFTVLSGLAYLLSGGSVAGAAVAFKALATVFGAVMAGAAFRLAEREGRSGLVPLVLVAWNPLILLETAGSGHNETVMMGLALVGLLVAEKGRPYLGFALVVLSTHVKWVTAALVALMALQRVRDRGALGSRARETALLLAVAALVTVAMYAPFWADAPSLGSTEKVLRGLQDRHSGLSAVSLRPSSLIAFAAVATVAAVVTWRRGRALLLEMAAVVILAFVILVFPWLFPWYLVSPLALLAVGPPKPGNRALLVVTTWLGMLLMLRWAVLIPGQSG